MSDIEVNALLAFVTGVLLTLGVVIFFASRKESPPHNVVNEESAIFSCLRLVCLELYGEKIVSVGSSSHDVLGYLAEEITGTSLLEYLHPDDVGLVQRWLQNLKQRLIPTAQTLNDEPLTVRSRHASGDWLWLELLVIESTARDDGNDKQSCKIVARDVTLQHRRVAREIGEQRAQGVGVLAQGVAHDLSDILTVITGFAELIESSEVREPILGAADDAAGLIQTLRAFAGPRAEDSKSADLSKVVRTAENLFRGVLPSTMQLHISFPDESVWVGLSIGQIHQMLLQLVTNAVEANMAQQEGPQANLWIDLEIVSKHGGAACEELPSGEYALITVSDDGCGMDLQTQTQAFEPFFTTKVDDRGTGLGLASVQGLTRQAGGRVSIESTLGGGASLSVYLPLTKPESAALPKVDPAVFAPAHGRILLVEDELRVADIIARSLVAAGYSVTIKHNIESAWRSLVEDTPDLLIADVMMPDGRATDLTERLQEQNLAAELPILFISGDLSLAFGEVKHDPERVQFLAKPFRSAELLERVARLLAGIRRAN